MCWTTLQTNNSWLKLLSFRQEIISNTVFHINHLKLKYELLISTDERLEFQVIVLSLHPYYQLLKGSHVCCHPILSSIYFWFELFWNTVAMYGWSEEHCEQASIDDNFVFVLIKVSLSEPGLQSVCVGLSFVAVTWLVEYSEELSRFNRG